MIGLKEPALELGQPGSCQDEQDVCPVGLWEDPAVFQAVVLAGVASVFTLEWDDLVGVRLASFGRLGGSTWQNLWRAPWRATFFDTTQDDADALYEVSAVAEDLSTTWFTATGGVQAVWEVTLVGGDSFRLMMTWEVPAGTDELEVSLAFVWLGSPSRWALDGIDALPLRVPPLDFTGKGRAVVPAVKGVMVYDPIYRFRYWPEDPELASLFGGKLDCWLTIGSGVSCCMPLAGYFEVGGDGWCWFQGDPSLEWGYAVFQSDGANMHLEVCVNQPDCLTAGNNASLELGWQSTFRLHVFQVQGDHGWLQMAARYRTYLASLSSPPSWLVDRWRYDSQLHDDQRAGFLWLHCDYRDSAYVDVQTDLVALIQLLRTNLGLTQEQLPILGFVNPNHFTGSRPYAPGTAQVDQEDADTYKEACAYAHKNLRTYLGHHKADAYFPMPYDEFQHHVPGAVAVVDDYWQTTQVIKAGFCFPQAALDGETDARRNTGSSADGYWRAEAKIVLSWNPSTGRLTFTTPFVTSWDVQIAEWVGTSVVLELASGIRARGHAIGQGADWLDINLPQGFRTRTGAIVQPEPGQTAIIHDWPFRHCYHAIDHSLLADYLGDVTAAKMRTEWQAGLFYYDVEPSRALRNRPGSSCYGTHSGWAYLESGYVPHPQGGGTWLLESKANRFRRLVSRARRKLSTPVWLFSEYLDQFYLDGISGGLHGLGMVTLHRGFDTSIDYSVLRMVSVPLFPAVHAGRAFGLNWIYEFGTGILSQISRNDLVVATAADIRLAFGYWVAGEWAWGLTPPSYFHLVGATTKTSAQTSLWDPDQYDPAHPWGAASSDVSGLRDLWTALVRAEVVWALRWLRMGLLLAPPEYLAGSTTFDCTAMFRTYTLGGSPIEISPRCNTSCVWEPGSYPRVVAACWTPLREDLRQVMAFLVNWTNTAAQANLRFDLDALGLSGEIVRVYRVSDAGALTLLTSAMGGTVDVAETRSAYSMEGVYLVPESEENVFGDHEIELVASSLESELPAGELEADLPASSLEIEARAASLETELVVPG